MHAENGDDDDAKADIEAGLELEPEHSELLWLKKQMKKTAGKFCLEALPRDPLSAVSNLQTMSKLQELISNTAFFTLISSGKSQMQ